MLEACIKEYQKLYHENENLKKNKGKQRAAKEFAEILKPLQGWLNNKQDSSGQKD